MERKERVRCHHVLKTFVRKYLVMVERNRSEALCPQAEFRVNCWPKKLDKFMLLAYKTLDCWIQCTNYYSVERKGLWKPY